MAKAESNARNHLGDALGALAASGCLLHCLALPLLWSGAHAWTWMHGLDLPFLVLGGLGAYWAHKLHPSPRWDRWLWRSWTLVALGVLLERAGYPAGPLVWTGGASLLVIHVLRLLSGHRKPHYPA